MSYQPLFLGLGTAVFRTNAGTNYLEGETANLSQNQLIKFVADGNNFIYGGVVADQVYYVKQVIDNNNFTISATLGGDVFELTDNSGFMLVRAIQKELPPESLRKVDSMLKEIYTVGLNGDGVGILSVQEDSAPALGGDLNLDNNDITGAGNINISGTVNATTLSGNFRGVLSGGLIGPVNELGVRTGNPTIDGLPFELGNPTGGQVISWDAPNSKFVLTSVSAVSGSDTLDDVLFRGNISNNSITVSNLITDTLTVNNGIDYADLNNSPTIPTDISNLTDTTGLLLQAGLSTRTARSATTGALAINASDNITITGFKTYALLAMLVEIPAWVRVYSSAAARTADASRLETEDPLPGSGIIAEVITTALNQSVLFTPATVGFNSEATPTGAIYLAVKNKGTGAATIEVTLTLLQLEA